MRSSTAVGFADALGRLTSIPRYIMGAVSMKMRRSTRTTSTNGMMLVSASVEWVRPPSAASGLNILRGPRHPRRRTAQEVEEVQREAVHLRGPVSHAVDEEVVPHHRGDGCTEPGGGGDEGLGDARRD